ELPDFAKHTRVTHRLKKRPSTPDSPEHICCVAGYGAKFRCSAIKIELLKNQVAAQARCIGPDNYFKGVLEDGIKLGVELAVLILVINAGIATRRNPAGGTGETDWDVMNETTENLTLNMIRNTDDIPQGTRFPAHRDDVDAGDGSIRVGEPVVADGVSVK